MNSGSAGGVELLSVRESLLHPSPHHDRTALRGCPQPHTLPESPRKGAPTVQEDVGVPTFEDLKLLDPCITSVVLRPDGFMEVRGVHHPYQVRKHLSSQGYRFISFIPCSCQEAKRKPKTMRSRCAQGQRLMHLRNHKRGEARPPTHPGPKKGYYK